MVHNMNVNYFDILKKCPTICEASSKISNVNDDLYIYNASFKSRVATLAASFLENKETILVVYANIFHANNAYLDFLEILGADFVSFFPVEELITQELLATTSDFRLARLSTIKNIIDNKPQIIVTNLEGFLRHVMSKEKIVDSFVKIKAKDICKKETLVEILTSRGYKKASLTESVGQFSTRGSVVDIYIVGDKYPVRINYFDDEIETIKYFDPNSQMSIEKISNIEIIPMYEIYYEKDQIGKIIENITLEKDKNNISEYNNLDLMYKYLPLIDEKYISFLELIGKPKVVFNEINHILEKEKLNILELSEFFKQNENIKDYGLFKSVKEIMPFVSKSVYFDQFSPDYTNLESKSIIEYNLKTNAVEDYNNNFKSLIDELNVNNKKTYILSHTAEDKLKFIESLLEANNVKYQRINDINELKNNTINTVVLENALGFNAYGDNTEIITPLEISKGKVTRHHKYQKLYNESKQIYSKEELSPGDYVVHRDYGIGIYKGIESITLGQTVNDYIRIEYANESKLYIPVANIYVLEKYIGNSERIPKLSKTNSKEWEKKKEKIKEKIKLVAKKLIDIQAKRELMQGYIYEKDSETQKEFENDFGFVETPGQLKACQDVKNDMESTRPMDRLVCGDVGFGKTEVAMRAAFKAVDNGKQVVYLVPTTVLARQHYYSFKERFEKYGVRVELLSRFVDKETTKKTLEGLKSGYVDIVIGTHRLLSNDVKFKSLGLLIIDEEHRFGVEHKERIKEIKANIDVLSLSATPIPRTMQMALTGLRDMSLIETPPVNRLSVQTYVLKTNESVIREAINRELGRGGQVFYLLNRITLLDSVKRKIKRLVPNAKVAIIHGGMDKDEIEDTLSLFLDKMYDVLVCTTIVETGIDIPNANTIIIEKTDLLGLAQLYQIRGRVGRSDKIAYAYLMYDKEHTLSDAARKRLDTIKEFTTLGSGYKIAMRDLAIRGAGDILGSEQSGFIDDIGIELYLKMLNEAIDEQKGKVTKEETRNINVNTSRHIDTNYVDDDAIRIDMHKSISKVTSRTQIFDLINEFQDRYGTLSEEIKIYIESRYLEYLLKQKGIESYKDNEKVVEFNFDKEKTKTINYKKIVDLSMHYGKAWNFKYQKERIYVIITLNDYLKSKSKTNYIYYLTKFLEEF